MLLNMYKGISVLREDGYNRLGSIDDVDYGDLSRVKHRYFSPFSFIEEGVGDESY